MTRAFIIGAILTVGAQVPMLLSPEWTRGTVVFAWAPLLAIVVFLLGLAFAARGSLAPRPAIILASTGAFSLALSTTPQLAATPQFLVAPAALLALAVVGSICLAMAAAWLCRRNWRGSAVGGSLIGLAGLLGGYEFLKISASRFSWHFSPDTFGLAGLYERTVELIALFGLGGLFSIVGAALAWRGRQQSTDLER